MRLKVVISKNDSSHTSKSWLCGSEWLVIAAELRLRSVIRTYMLLKKDLVENGRRIRQLTKITQKLECDFMH